MTRIPRQLAQVYAQSLFELAKEQHVMDAFKKDLDLLSAVAEQEGDFIRLLGSPYFSVENKEGLLNKTLSGRVGELTLNFLKVALKHHRAAILPAILVECDKLWDEYCGCCPVKVTVCRPLDDGEVSKLRADIAEAVDKKVRLAVVVDPQIMGGMEIRYGEMLIDNTIRNRLQRAVKTVIGHVRAGG